MKLFCSVLLTVILTVQYGNAFVPFDMFGIGGMMPWLMSPHSKVPVRGTIITDYTDDDEPEPESDYHNSLDNKVYHITRGRGGVEKKSDRDSDRDGYGGNVKVLVTRSPKYEKRNKRRPKSDRTKRSYPRSDRSTYKKEYPVRSHDDDKKQLKYDDYDYSPSKKTVRSKRIDHASNRHSYPLAVDKYGDRKDDHPRKFEAIEYYPKAAKTTKRGRKPLRAGRQDEKYSFVMDKRDKKFARDDFDDSTRSWKSDIHDYAPKPRLRSLESRHHKPERQPYYPIKEYIRPSKPVFDETEDAMHNYGNSKYDWDFNAREFELKNQDYLNERPNYDFYPIPDKRVQVDYDENFYNHLPNNGYFNKNPSPYEWDVPKYKKDSSLYPLYGQKGRIELESSDQPISSNEYPNDGYNYPSPPVSAPRPQDQYDWEADDYRLPYNPPDYESNFYPQNLPQYGPIVEEQSNVPSPYEYGIPDVDFSVQEYRPGEYEYKKAPVMVKDEYVYPVEDYTASNEPSQYGPVLGWYGYDKDVPDYGLENTPEVHEPIPYLDFPSGKSDDSAYLYQY